MVILAKDSTAGALIDIDASPDLVIELDARVVCDDTGQPVIVPLRASAWRAGLGRMIDRLITVTLTREKERRSQPANRFYWVLLENFAERMRAKAQDEKWPTCPINTKDRAHAWAKHRFIPPSVEDCGGVEIETPPTTTLLTPAQFSRYIRSIVETVMDLWDIDLTDVSDRE